MAGCGPIVLNTGASTGYLWAISGQSIARWQGAIGPDRRCYPPHMRQRVFGRANGARCIDVEVLSGLRAAWCGGTMPWRGPDPRKQAQEVERMSGSYGVGTLGDVQLSIRDGVELAEAACV